MDNAKIMRETLTSLGLKVYGGVNAPYLWVKTPGNTDSWKFFEQMLYGAQVVCTPGVGFGPSGEGFVRLTAFGEREDCKGSHAPHKSVDAEVECGRAPGRKVSA